MDEPNVPGLSITLSDIRAMKAQLCSKAVLPKNYYGYCAPELRDGIVHMGLVQVHPASFLDMFGADLFRKIKRDVSEKRIEKFIKKWQEGGFNIPVRKSGQKQIFKYKDLK